MRRLSRRSLLKAAARLGAGAALAALGIGKGASQAQDLLDEEGPYFRESATTLTLGNRYYEVDFDRRNGAITRIFDKRGGGVVSEGNAHRTLWSLWQGERGETYVASSFDDRYVDFTWRWEPTKSVLTFTYHVTRGESRVAVQITVDINDTPSFDLTATIQNQAGARLDWIQFPDSLAFPVEHIRQGLHPHLPGILFQRPFFESGPIWSHPYPGNVCCGDLTWIEQTRGTVAISAIAPSGRLPAEIGFWHLHGREPSTTTWRHSLAMAIEPTQSYTSPAMRIAVGDSLPTVIADYRRSNSIDHYPSLRKKVDDQWDTLRHAPLHKISAGSLAGRGFPTFADYHKLLSHSTSPGLLHPIDQYDLDFHEISPGWWPPSEALGGEQGYTDALSAAQREGFLVMPYSDPMSWNALSPTANRLAAQGVRLEDIAVRNYDGTPNTAFWLEKFLSIVASPADTRSVEQLDIIIDRYISTESDLAFLDEVGAKWWIWDFHPSAERPIDYQANFLDLTRRYSHVGLMTEGGNDYLAETHVGFCGTYLTWEFFFDHLDLPDGSFRYYPLSALMVRDKALLYQHPLEGHGSPSVTTSLRMLRWNLAYGHQLNFDLYGYDDPWLHVALAFSHHVLGKYADELMIEWSGSPNEVTVSRFDNATVTANWTNKPVLVGEDMLVPGGVVSTFHDGSVTGGVFRRYNGLDLSPGEHYLIEQRNANGVIVRQPMGDSTPLRLSALPGWAAVTPLKLRSFNRSDHLLAARSASMRGDSVNVRYESVAASAREWSSFRASISLGEQNVEDGLREVDLGWTTTVATTRDGRECRRETELTSADAVGFISFALERDILGPAVEADVLVDVDWWDGGGVEGSEHDWLGLVFDGAEFEDDNEHSAVSGGWAQAVDNRQWMTARFTLPRAVFRKRVWDAGVDIALIVPGGVCIGKVTVTNADELERRTAAYYTIHDPTQGETLPQGLHLRGWTDATQPIADLNLDGLQAIYAWDAEAASWLLYSPDVPARFYTLDTLEQGRAYYVRVRNGQTLHWPDAPYGGVGFHLQLGRNLVCWLGTPNKSLTDAIAPLRGMKAEPLVSVTLDGRTYDVEESRSATEPLPYGQALWVEIDAVGPTRWLQF